MGFITSRNKTNDGQLWDRDLRDSKEEKPDTGRKETQPETNLIDLGALLLPPVAGMNLGFLGEDEEPVVGVEVVIGKAQMQLAAFAAPRSGGYWEEQLEELQEMFSSQGFAVFPLPGKYGEALLVKPQESMKDEDLKRSLPMLFWGIEKDRSLLRVIFRGAAAENEKDREELVSVIEKVIVNRGDSPMAPGDLLALHAPTGLKRIG